MTNHGEPLNLGDQQPQPQKRQHPLANYQFTSEELKVIRECNRDSFFQRSLPFGSGLGLAAYYAVKNNYLSPSTRFGATPKVVVGVILGYFIGKFSYQRKCAEKIMALPNSKLGEMLKARKKGSKIYDGFTPDTGFGTALSLSPFSTPSDGPAEQFKQVSSLNLDTDRPNPSGLDDTLRGNVDSPITTFEDDLPTEPPKHTVTYDELRKRNRDDYSQKTQAGYKPPPADYPKVTRTPERTEAVSTQSNGEKNKYGDVWTQ